MSLNVLLRNMEASPLIKSADQGKMPLGGSVSGDAPVCRECGSLMNHIFSINLDEHSTARIRATKKVLQVFQCQSDPGMCDDWNSESGANAVSVVDEPQNVADSEVFGLALDTSRIVRSQDELIELLECDKSCVGAMGDEPLWIQGDETPTCSCGTKMDFVAQVEEFASPNFNFGGGGCSFVFLCVQCQLAKLLWQS